MGEDQRRPRERLACSSTGLALGVWEGPATALSHMFQGIEGERRPLELHSVAALPHEQLRLRKPGDEQRSERSQGHCQGPIKMPCALPNISQHSSQHLNIRRFIITIHFPGISGSIGISGHLRLIFPLASTVASVVSI